MLRTPRSIHRAVFYVPTDGTTLDGFFYYQVTPRSPLRGPFTTREEAMADAYFWSNQDRKLYPEKETP